MARDEGIRADAELIFERYRAALHRLVWSYASDPQEAQDLLQEICIALWKAIRNFRGEASEKTYVYRIAHNVAFKFVTSKRRNSRREHLTDAIPEMVSSPHQEQDVIREQRRQALWRAIRRLPLTNRRLITLHLEGLSVPEIAAVTGFTEGKVTMRLSRIRKGLTQDLQGGKRSHEIHLGR